MDRSLKGQLLQNTENLYATHLPPLTERAKNFINGPQAIQPDEPPAELSQPGLAPPIVSKGGAKSAPCLELPKSESQTDQSLITDPVENALPYKSTLQTDAHLELTSLKEQVCKQIDEC